MSTLITIACIVYIFNQLPSKIIHKRYWQGYATDSNGNFWD